MRTVCGQGVCSVGKHIATIDGKATKLYSIWSSMIKRCYSKAYQNNKPTYIGCEVSEEFKDFQKFSDWAVEQVGFGVDGWHLDKDILKIGNKVYCQEYCCFVPREINSLMNSHSNSRGHYPMGVTYNKRYNSYRSEFSEDGKTQQLGSFKTQEEAFAVYKEKKEEYILRVASKWRHLISENVYIALLKIVVHPFPERCQS